MNQENTTAVTAGAPTVQSAQYCDQLPGGGAAQGMAGGAGVGNQTTQGMAGGMMPGNATTTTTPGMAAPSNATTTTPPPGLASNVTGMPTNATTGGNTTTTVTPPPAGGTVRKGSKKLNLRHW
jgi:hypothetical protein